MRSRNISPRQSRGQILVPMLLTSVLIVQSLVAGYLIWHDYFAGEGEKVRQEHIEEKLVQIFDKVSQSARSKADDTVLKALLADNERLKHQLEDAQRPPATGDGKASRKAVVVPKRVFPRDTSSAGAGLLKDARDSGADTSHDKAEKR